jgi:hypothetical protein
MPAFVDVRPLPPVSRCASALWEKWWLYVVIVVAAVLIRAPTFGNPNYHIDEGFYLLVGDRMRGGALPYVDIWDRKPFGLFLLYWLIAVVGRGNMLAVQIAACIAATGTAMGIAAIARRWVAPLPALLAALLYLAGLEMLAGGGGQSPVFYNGLLTAMAWATLSAGAEATPDRARRLAARAALCGGLALTIKPTALAECLFLGTLLARQEWRRVRTPAALLRTLTSLAALGMAPTLLCLGFFTARGYAGEYLFATVASNFARMPMAGTERLALAAYLVPRVVPLVLLALAGAAVLMRRRERAGAGFVVGWVCAAGLGFLMVPNFYDHYALPLLPPLAVAAAPMIARRPLGSAIATGLIGWSLTLASWPAVGRTMTAQAAMARAVQAIGAAGGTRSLYVYDGPPQLYMLTGAPLPTHRVFPEHLSTAEEQHATGIDATQEVARILSTRPAVIVTTLGEGPRHPNPASRLLIRAAIARDYRQVAVVALPSFGMTQTIAIFAQRSK